MIRKISNVITIINVVIELVLMLRLVMKKMALEAVVDVIENMAYPLIKLYIVFSGPVSYYIGAVFWVLLVISIFKKNTRNMDIVMLCLNIQYLVFWRFIYIPMG